MKLPTESKERILVAQQKVHKGAMFGVLSNGGQKSIGNYIIEVVADGSMFPTIQIYQCGLGITPRVQSWVKSKKVVEKVESKPKQQKITETMNVNTEVKNEDLSKIDEE